MITPVSQQAAVAAATQRPAPLSSETGDPTSAAGTDERVFANGDFETFLKMLTTQLKHQDPMNPMEGSDFAVQLATFSGVEQQTYTNKLLTQLTTQNGGGLDGLAGWIGREAKTTAPVAFTGRPLTLDIQPDPRAESVQLVTRDGAGREIMREEIGPGQGEIDWAGRSSTGAALAPGLYTFTIESVQAGETIAEAAVGVFARVTGATTTRDGAALVFEGGGTALMSKVEALREPR